MRIRSFIALELSEQFHSKLDEIIRRLNAVSTQFRWAKTHQTHLTLRFLESIEESKITTIAAAFSKTLSQIPPFLIGFGGINGFPSLEKCRVLWLGVQSGTEPCRMLKNAVDDALVSFSCPKEPQNFVPHVTLGRSKTARAVDARPLCVLISENLDAEKIKSLSIFKSELKPKGPIHTRLTKIIFSGNN